MATAQQPQTFEDVTRAISETDPQRALEIVLAHTQAVQAAYERDKLEAREQAEVKIGPHGFEATNMAGLYRIARMFADSDMVPDHFKRNVANCFIAIQMAMRCKCDPMAFLQKCYLVHGKPAIESQLAIAMANSSGILKGRIKYEMSGEGDSRACRAHALLEETGELIEETVSMKQAKDMGWIDKKDSMWKKMPELMLKYRAAMWLIRTNAPEVLMGLLSHDEAVDIGVAPTLPEDAPTSLDDLVAKRNGSTIQQEERSNGNEQLAQKMEENLDPETGLAPGEAVDDKGEISGEGTLEEKAPPDRDAWRGESVVNHAKSLGAKNVAVVKKQGIATLGQLWDRMMAGVPDDWNIKQADLDRMSQALDQITVDYQMAADGVGA